jgi:hypothetical protein
MSNRLLLAILAILVAVAVSAPLVVALAQRVGP